MKMQLEQQQGIFERWSYVIVPSTKKSENMTKKYNPQVTAYF